MKTISNFFLSLVFILVVIQPLSAEDLNRSSNYSGTQTISLSLVSTNLTSDETTTTVNTTSTASTAQPARADIVSFYPSITIPINATTIRPFIFYGQEFPSVNTSVSLRNATKTNTTLSTTMNVSSQNAVDSIIAVSNTTGSVSYGSSRIIFSTNTLSRREYASDHIIVRFKSRSTTGPSISSDKIRLAHAKVGAKVKKDFSSEGVPGLQVVQLANGTDVQSAIREYQSNPDVLYAEPDYVITISLDEARPAIRDANPLQILSTTPNDTSFTQLWGLHNTGQTGGTPGADINATAAWDISTGSNSVIVAVVDTGVLYTHSDLSANIWTNPGEIPGNGIDDDHNGYIDDVHGWNFVANTSDPLDDNGHGTHVSGTIGAVGNNGMGVAGVNWHVKIMALKVFNAAGQGNTTDAISAILYANANGASVISNSWGGSGNETALKDAIDVSPVVIVCAAGNNGKSNDNIIFAQYPASFNSANIISVAASDQTDQLAYFSNYGPISVDLAAPGTNILSTYFNGGYLTMDGTSMATPHVSGVAALVKSVNQSLTAVQIKDIILSTVDTKSSLSGMVSTGGRLDAYRAVAATPPAPPVADFTGTPRNGTLPLTVTFMDLSANLPTSWNWMFGDGNTTNSTVQYPIHTYTVGGNYTVSLTATNALGSNTATGSGYVNVTAPPQLANFTGTPTTGTAPLTVTFTDLSTNAPTGWLWSFGDGNVTGATLQNPVHTYLIAGNNTVALNASHSGGFNTMTKVGYINVTNIPLPTKIGTYQDGVWHRDFAGTGTYPGLTSNFGTPGNTSVMGDWNGDGITEIGGFNNGTWYLDYNGNGIWDGPTIDKTASFGQAGDIPIVGDWNGDGKSKIGFYRNGLWAVDYSGNYAWEGATIDRNALIGFAGATPLIGDWNGDGKSKIGFYQNNLWAFDYNGNYAWEGMTIDRAALIGATGAIPVIGDWNSNGKSKLGFFTNGLWAFDYNGNFAWDGMTLDRAALIGQTGDFPVIGDWNSDGRSKLGFFRNGLWALDYNGNFAWDESPIDKVYLFGQAGDLSIVGKWS